MEIIHGSQREYESPGLNHRGGGIEFKCLSLGDENTPENYSLNLARQKDFYSPEHHHNFDQFRYAVRGDVSLGPNMLLKEGQLSYHPEGAYYGPQTDDPGQERIVLVLQCGGASGQGYVSFAQLRQANKQLSATGKFEGGKYYAEGGSVKDGYQALWEHVNGRKLEYPKARYKYPIIIDPESFAWSRVEAAQVNGTANHDNASAKPHKPGVFWRRPLGTFSERELRVEELMLGAEACLSVGSADAIHLLVVLDGSGRAGSEDLRKESTIRLKPGSTVEIVGAVDLLLMHFVLPLLNQ